MGLVKQYAYGFLKTWKNKDRYNISPRYVLDVIESILNKVVSHYLTKNLPSAEVVASEIAPKIAYMIYQARLSQKDDIEDVLYVICTRVEESYGSGTMDKLINDSCKLIIRMHDNYTVYQLLQLILNEGERIEQLQSKSRDESNNSGQNSSTTETSISLPFTKEFITEEDNRALRKICETKMRQDPSLSGIAYSVANEVFCEINSPDDTTPVVGKTKYIRKHLHESIVLTLLDITTSPLYTVGYGEAYEGIAKAFTDSIFGEERISENNVVSGEWGPIVPFTKEYISVNDNVALKKICTDKMQQHCYMKNITNCVVDDVFRDYAMNGVRVTRDVRNHLYRKVVNMMLYTAMPAGQEIQYRHIFEDIARWLVVEIFGPVDDSVSFDDEESSEEEGEPDNSIFSTSTCVTSMDQEININNVGEHKVPLMTEENTAKSCVVCLDKKVTHIVLPCAHLTYCEVCGPKLTNCALCRKVIKECKVVYT